MATPCVVCEEVCPTSPKAITLEPVDVVRADGTDVRVRRPRLDPDRCVGCGLCEAKCPVAAPAAIRVTRAGESRHPQTASRSGGRHDEGARSALLRARAPVLPRARPVALAPEPSLAARTRQPALAGSWYPDGRARLVSAAHLLMRIGRRGPALPARPVALVVPHAGWNYSGPRRRHGLPAC